MPSVLLAFCASLPKTVIEGKIEANEALSKKDFVMRIKICRKEAKESGHWLRLVEVTNPSLGDEQAMLLKESTELA